MAGAIARDLTSNGKFASVFLCCVGVEMNSHDQPSDRMEALKALFENSSTGVRHVSQRSYATTIQGVSLNIAVVAALVASPHTLSFEGQVVGTLLVFLFNFVVVEYLSAKARSHHRLLLELHEVKEKLRNESGMQCRSDSAVFEESFWRGSGLFIAAVIFTGIVTLLSFWFPLTE